MIKRCLTSLVATLIVCFLACSSASARVCFLPDSTDCGEGDVAGSGNVDVPCQYSNCPAHNTNYQTCYTERIYNNGGVNVECKQVKCILSESECKKQEADPNSSQCCNFDSASGCYYMGSCKLCNRDVYDSEKNLGEGYDCHPCKDKNGTFYNCTAKEKECNQINSNYTSSCGDSQIAKEVEGIKDSHGNQCYTCVDKPAGCTYEYRQATTEDSDGVTGDLDNSGKCTNGTQCWKNLWKITSLNIDTGTPSVKPINKISNKSATCVDDKGVTRYQTICKGTPKSKCSTYGKGYDYEFKPNGCVSDTYNNGFEVKGDEWGDCVKKEETCTYEYTRIDYSDTHGDSTFSYSLYNDFQNHRQNTRGAGIYWNGLGDPNHNVDYSDFQMYSRIDKNSKSCQKISGVTAYETICPGTARAACKKDFVPNGCSSEQYVVYRLTVESMDFGDCICDRSNGHYDTAESCSDATGLKCTEGEGKCYQTCEAAGMYSTEDACKTNAPKYTECKSDADSNCYVRNKIGWGIHYTHNVEKWNNREYKCKIQIHESGVSNYVNTSWNVSVINANNYGAAQALNGKTYWSIDNHEGEVRYPAGKYKICFNYAYGGTTHYIYPNSIHLAKRNGDACDYRLGDNDDQWHPDKNNKEFCSNVNINTISGSNEACMIATFEDNTEYYVGGSFNSVSGYSCQRLGSSPY